MSRISIGVATAVLMLSGCEGIEERSEDAAISPEEILTCPASNPREGRAVIDFMPGIVEPPVLNIDFLVDTPSGGDVYELVFENIQESAPPSYVYNLKRKEAGLTDDYSEWRVEHAVSAFPEGALRSIVINCEGNRFYEIEPIEVVEN